MNKKNIIKNCIKCGKSFEAFWWNIEKGGGKYCSQKCRRTSEGRFCITCGKGFMASKWNIDKGGGKFCSHSCQKGKYNPFWHGGLTKHQRGYILIRKPEHPFTNSRGYVSEHRLVIETKIERYLNPKEVVHHINGIKDDNRIENLKLFANNSEHLREERRNRIYGNR